MKHVIDLELDEVTPARESVLLHQGIPDSADIPEHILDLVNEADEIFSACARPRGLFVELDKSEFADVFGGEGQNASDAVVANVYPRASRLALYALTMGEEVSERIAEMFEDSDFALGSMLDSVASQAADTAAEAMALHYLGHLHGGGGANEDDFVLGYSPGYCGWHVTGQRKLFEHLQPEEIGITLNQSCLMSPLKSVSGVLVSGPKDAHLFKPGFSYCPTCRDFSCLERIERLLAADA